MSNIIHRVSQRSPKSLHQLRPHRLDVVVEKIRLKIVHTQFKCSQTLGKQRQNEPPHDKTNKMTCAPNEDSDQPGHPPSLIRVFAARMKEFWVLSYILSRQRRFWSDWADAQADLSLCWAHRTFCWFCHESNLPYNVSVHRDNRVADYPHTVLVIWKTYSKTRENIPTRTDG